MMHVDSLIVIPNERLKLISQEKITLMNAFEAADNVLRQGVESISSLINIPAFINLDFADVRSIMKDAGFAPWVSALPRAPARPRTPPRLPSPARCWRPASPVRAASSSTSPPAPTLVWRMSETAASMITQSAHPDANIIWGTAFDERLSDEMSITVVATGLRAPRGGQSRFRPMWTPSAPPSRPLYSSPHQPVQPVQPPPPCSPHSSPSTRRCPTPSSPSLSAPAWIPPVAAQPAAPAEEEDDGDYFDDLLSILNKRS